MEKEGIKMKTYTDLEQSKKLAEILPLESADMHYNNVSVRGVNYVDDYMAELMDYNTATKVLSKYSINPLFGVVPCWSLAALLTLYPIVVGEDMGMYICWCNKHNLASRHYDNPVDACVEMIIKLHEQNLL